MSPKWTEAKNIKTMVIMFMALESKEAMDRFLVLNPPVDATLKAWLMASKADIPASQ